MENSEGEEKKEVEKILQKIQAKILKKRILMGRNGENESKDGGGWETSEWSRSHER